MAASRSYKAVRRRGRLQFSLLSLMAFVAFASIAMSLVSVRLRASRQRAAVEKISWQSPGEVGFSYQVDASGSPIWDAKPRAAQWLRTVFGDDAFREVVYVRTTQEKDMEQVAMFPHLRWLFLWNRPSKGVESDPLALLSQRSTVGDAGLLHLHGIVSFKHLRQLSVLGDTDISDKGLEYLTEMKELKSLHLMASRVTPTGASRFQRAQPDCKLVIPLIEPSFD